MPGQDWFEKDFYAVLGVPVDASADAIKKAYRKLARTHHPDANAGDARSEARFKEVGEAYSVLGDTEQRAQYDQVRTMARGGARFTAGAPGGAGGFEDVFGGLFQPRAGGQQTRFTTSSAGNGGLDDVLAAMFNGGNGAPGRASAGFRAPSRGEDLTAEVTITFRQALEGAELTLRVPGQGGVRTVTARMPAGVRDGQKIKVPGRGRPAPGGTPGDLVVTVHVEPDSVFTLDGQDLRVTLPVTFVEAALGATVEVPTATGETVKVKIAAGTSSGTVLRVKGRGVSARSRTGDLMATVQVVVPQRLGPTARQALEEFAVALGEAPDPREGLIARARARAGTP